MEPTHDSRGLEDAAAEKTAGPGGNGTRETPQSEAPRSWRQYIEQAPPEAEAEEPAPNGKRRAKGAWERFARRTARWARECGKKARGAAAVCREKLGGAGETARETLGSPVALCRERLEPIAARCRERLRPLAEKLEPGAEKVRAAIARHPVSPLLYATLLAVFIGAAAFQGSYARAYVLEVNDQKLGLVTGEDEVNAILSSVESRAASILGDGFDYDVSVTLSPVYAAPGDLTDAAEVEDALFEVVGAYVTTAYTAPANAAEDKAEGEPATFTAWALSVDGEELAVAGSKDEFYQLLDEIAQIWLPENAVRYEFVEDVQVRTVELIEGSAFDDLEALREELTALRVEKAVYVVQKGNTFNAIARSLGMTPSELSALNPDVTVDKLFIGQELVIQQAVPRLSVMAVTEETYEETIPSPVEYIETADLYKGDTKVKTQGEAGLALVSAQVTYINNRETAREVLESTTLKEATTTYTYTGTTPKPTTASKGYFIWPVTGTITSNFGYRYIFGSTSFHNGIDIAVPTGTTVKAADGGTVIKAGWEGSYGILVAIRHDNGLVTYYGHNSSVLVSVGDKVYQGQAIAKSGATGNATGPHCHFEVRVNNTSVNPRNYMK